MNEIENSHQKLKTSDEWLKALNTIFVTEVYLKSEKKKPLLATTKTLEMKLVESSVC